MEELRQHALKHLSKAQLAIFDNVDAKPGLQMVEAAAGSGKTRTLSYLILKMLLNEQISNVMVLTSTKTAKFEAFARTQKLFTDVGFDRNGQCRPLYPKFVRTIHALTYGAAKEQAEEEGVDGFELISPQGVKDMLEEILTEVEHGKNGKTSDTMRTEISIDEMTTEDAASLLRDVRTERLHGVLDVIDDSFGPSSQRALQTLQERMNKNTSGVRVMDFDLLLEAYRKSGNTICTTDDVLFVDEGQDLSLCQVRIVLNLLKAGGTVIMLGDDSQGIFQFSGACAKTLSTLKSEAQGFGIPVKRFGLFQNHRSTNRIVRASETLLPFSDRSTRVGVRGNGVEGEPVEVRVHKSEADEAREVAKRIVELMQEQSYTPEDVVVLRHRNWQWRDPLVMELQTQAAKHGIDIPITIVGQDATNSLSGRFLAVLQATLAMETFSTVQEYFEVMKAFLKSIKGGKGWNQKLGIQALQNVLEKNLTQDASTLFGKYRECVLAEFRLLEAQDDAELAAKNARMGRAAKKRPLANTGLASQKERNFERVLKLAAQVVREVRERARRLALGHTRFEPIVVGADLLHEAAARQRPQTTPTLEHPLGGLAWLLLRDVVAYEYTVHDAHEIQKIVSLFDRPFDKNEGDAVDQMGEGIAHLSNVVHDKATAGKLKFSTIHKYKGLEEKVAIVVSLTQPISAPSWPKRATLAFEHTPGCANRSGQKTQCCTPFQQGLERLKDAEVAEKLRLFYVAASRAKERLFLSGLPSSSGTYLTALENMRAKTTQWTLLP